MSDLPRLSRDLPGLSPDVAAPAPVRIVHLGLGNFHRAHQAWYTAHAPDAGEWGIAAFTGRRPDAAAALAPQDGLYTLITRHGEQDEFETVPSISAVHPADDHDRFLDYLRRPEVALVTITVTEAGYRPDPDGGPSMPATLVAGLAARREAGVGGLSVVSCDNLPDNGKLTRQVLLAVAAEQDEQLAGWIEHEVEFVSSVVDRITPATTDDDRAAVESAQGWQDASPVPTEPFSEWVLAGTFTAGRPRWEDAGARLVEDVAPFERRKLWLLNGSHSLLAYAASIRGHETVDQAIADADCRSWVESFWDEAARHLDFPAAEIDDYRSALLDRYANPRVRHLLAQIAADGSTKLPIRTLPIVRAERGAGRVPLGCATTLAAWTLHLRGSGAPVKDPDADRMTAIATDGTLTQVVPKVLDALADGLGSDDDLVAAVVQRAAVVSS